MRAGARPKELDVQPVRDGAVADLQSTALAERRAKRFDAAAVTLDRAIALLPGDPSLLQDRAEIALLSGQLEDALQRARAAHAAGPKVGPLCRRSIEVQLQAALRSGADAAALQALRDAREACTSTPPPRY